MQPLHVFLVYYLFTIHIEMSVLVVLLSRRHTVTRKLLAGVWLTACTYPVVWYVIPLSFDPVDERLWYLIVAETFAPLAECLIFWAAFVRGLPPARGQTVRDMGAIVLANLASFGVGELLTYSGLRLL